MRKSRRNTNVRRRRSVARKLTPAALRRLVLEEAAKLDGELEPVEKVSADEVEASEYADTLEQDLDIYKAMKIKEAKLRRQHQKIVREARKIRRNKNIAKKRILRKLK